MRSPSFKSHIHTLTRPEFDQSLTLLVPPAEFSVPLAALWWISNNNWQTAHDLIDAEAGSDAAWVHAYLHLIEGDEGNANYWYARAGREKPTSGLGKEREVLIGYFLEN